MAPIASGAIAAAVLLDALAAEFPESIHPVALFGNLVAFWDRSWRHPKAVGTVLAIGLPLGAAGLLGGLTTFAASHGTGLAAVIAALALFSTISLRMLRSVTRQVVDLTETDLEQARTEVRSLVGRDASTLSAGDLRSAAVESLAENFADGFVAPLFAFVLGAQGSVAFGVAAAVWVKAVNTLDSMLGYPTKPLGWASARLDDAVMWIPARLSAVLIAIAAWQVTALRDARPWIAAPPSPNSGWPMATLAVVLDVRLEKPGAYSLHPAADLPTVADTTRGLDVIGRAGALAAILAVVIAWF